MIPAAILNLVRRAKKHWNTLFPVTSVTSWTMWTPLIFNTHAKITQVPFLTPIEWWRTRLEASTHKAFETSSTWFVIATACVRRLLTETLNTNFTMLAITCRRANSWYYCYVTYLTITINTYITSITDAIIMGGAYYLLT